MTFVEEVQSVPPAAKGLMKEVLAARLAGRAKPLRMDEAALLREHGLIDDVCRPTSKGSAVAKS